MRCTSPITVTPFGTHGMRFEVACGQCLACRITRTSQWTARLTSELTNWDKACFVTLTYDEEHLASSSLVKKDFQLFMKRLRKYSLGRNMKYYACGEYGQDNMRPHFHAIIFGVGTDMTDRQLIAKSWGKCPDIKFTVPQYKGVGSVTPDSIRYVTGYIQKKYTGSQGKEEYENKGLVPPFSLSSQGLGLDYALKHSDRLNEYGYYDMINGKVPIPKYIQNKIGYTKTETERAMRLIKDAEKYGINPEPFLSTCNARLLEVALSENQLARAEQNSLNTKLIIKGENKL